MIHIRNAFVNSARSAIYDKRLVAKLEQDRPLWSLKEQEQKLAELGYSGDALYNKLIGDAIDPKVLQLETQKDGACFVAGTLVHTNRGLVQIQNIKVGDKVLSRDENNPNGELVYKPVTSTFESPEKKKVVRISFSPPRILSLDNINKAIANNPNINDALAIKGFFENALKEYGLRDKYPQGEARPSTHKAALYCSEDHPFWTEQYGWILAKNILSIHDLSKYGAWIDTRLVNFLNIPMEGVDFGVPTPLLRTNVPNVAVYADYWSRKRSGYRQIVDFRGDIPLIVGKHPRAIDSSMYLDNEEHYIFDPTDPTMSMLCEDKLLIESDIYNHAMGRFELNENGRYINENWDDYDAMTEEEQVIDDEKGEAYTYYETTVYNIEVADTHTYFVGKHGIWVHNTNGCFTENEPDNELTVDEFLNGARVPINSPATFDNA